MSEPASKGEGDKMVQQYNKRLEEARLELAGNIRSRVRRYMEEGCPKMEISYSNGGIYYIKDGRLYTHVATSPRSSELKEITPDELPLENNYSASGLLEMARKISAG